jgi:predicted NUDIX family phosphoesterase
LTRKQERILVIPRTATGELGGGFVPIEDDRAARIVDAICASHEFLDRSRAECDPERVQPIAIAYIAYDDSVLVLRRDGRDRSEALRGRDVLWVGGHIDSSDGDRHASDGGNDIITQGIRREIDEELPTLPMDVDPELVGLVTDNGSVRSRLHLGLVHRVRIHDSGLARAVAAAGHVSGDDACRPAFVPITELRRQPDLLEPWSRSILALHLDRVEATSLPPGRIVSPGAGAPPWALPSYPARDVP